MKTSMTLFGCGPKLALICLPYVILSLIVMYRYPEFFNLRFLDLTFIKALGFVWLGVGIIFWIFSAIFFLKHFKPGKLIVAISEYITLNTLIISLKKTALI